MRLTLHTVGGFTGPAGAQTRTVDLDKLDPAEASRLRTLVESIDFDALPPSITKQRPQSWDFMQTLEVVGDDGRTHKVRFHSEAAPPALSELADLLTEYPPG
jgi:hypothetical protein